METKCFFIAYLCPHVNNLYFFPVIELNHYYLLINESLVIALRRMDKQRTSTKYARIRLLLVDALALIHPTNTFVMPT